MRADAGFAMPMTSLSRLVPWICAWLLLVAGLGAVRASEPGVVLVMGDSLTAGYGLPDPSTQAYPALLQGRIDSRPELAGRWKVINAGVSGDTTSGGLRRADWVSRRPVAVLVLALGSNDGLRGLDPSMAAGNLEAIADRIAARHPGLRVLLLGQRMPTSMGEYADRFAGMFSDLATKRAWAFAPFLLDGVGGVPEMNQGDAIHPNEAGHRRMADTVWAALEPLLTAPAPKSDSAP